MVVALLLVSHYCHSSEYAYNKTPLFPSKAWTGSYFLVNGIRKQFNQLRAPLSTTPPHRYPLWKKLALPLYPGFWSGQSAFRLPPPIVLSLNSATAVAMLLYGWEYFWGKREKMTM